ncbi:hypothetical protein [Neisseria lactamica]|uniref:Protein YjdM N-terminal domain-containing protein n=1 Tax=Neisseria lactamica TaxID=486 RepID=A0AAU8VCR7_NEILA|nr:hypothetical protein B2G52_02405 [Neisseria lactamica]
MSLPPCPQCASEYTYVSTHRTTHKAPPYVSS